MEVEIFAGCAVIGVAGGDADYLVATRHFDERFAGWVKLDVRFFHLTLAMGALKVAVGANDFALIYLGLDSFQGIGVAKVAKCEALGKRVKVIELHDPVGVLELAISTGLGFCADNVVAISLFTEVACNFGAAFPAMVSFCWCAVGDGA